MLVTKFQLKFDTLLPCHLVFMEQALWCHRTLVSYTDFMILLETGWALRMVFVHEVCTHVIHHFRLPDSKGRTP